MTPGPNPFKTNSRRPFLEIDVKGGREITSKLITQREAYHFEKGESITSTGGERDLQGERILKKRVFLKDPRCLVFKRRDATCLLEGKDMFICAYLH